jgi:hypothetical protein
MGVANDGYDLHPSRVQGGAGREAAKGRRVSEFPDGAKAIRTMRLTLLAILASQRAEKRANLFHQFLRLFHRREVPA